MLKEKPEYFLVKEVKKLKLGNGRYGIFLLRKRDYTTLKAIRLIAKILKVNEKEIGYAGNKDKRAVTEQYISIGGIGERAENLKIRDIELEYIGKSKERIRLGDLEGNKFRIKIDGEIEKYDFFENYFGEQRFGRENWIIGKKIVKNEKVDVSDKKELKFCFHAYQSYLWNEVLRRILRKYEHLERNGYVFLKKKIKNFKIPLISFDTKLKGEIGRIYKELLDKESIKQEDFLVRRMPFLVAETVYRNAIVKVKDFKHRDGWVEFFLPKGAYATVYLRKILVQS